MGIWAVARAVTASLLILLASACPGVAQQIVAQPDDVLLHDGKLVTQAASLDQCCTETVLEQAPAGRGQAHPHLPLVSGIADAVDNFGMTVAFPQFGNWWSQN